MASLFVVLSLLVGRSKDEVKKAVATSVDRQWLLGLDKFFERVLLGVGIEMGTEPWRLIGGGYSSIQPFELQTRKACISLKLSRDGN